MHNKIKGVLFDKDGTLLEINTLWVPIAEALRDRLLMLYPLSMAQADAIFNELGMENHALKPDSVLWSGSTGEIVHILADRLEKYGEQCDYHRLETEAAYIIASTVKDHAQLIVPRGNLVKTLTELRKAGIKIGLATSDLYESAITCLQHLHIDTFFDYIGADTGKGQNKPAPNMLNDFCLVCNLLPSEVAVVGDSQVDMDMARNGGAGLAIAAVQKGAEISERPPLGADYSVELMDDLLLCPCFSD